MPSGKRHCLIDLLVVCYEHDRDEIRSRLIGWLQNQDMSLKRVEGYKNLLKSYFDLVDENEDGKLDATEFREFVAANQSADEVLPLLIYVWLGLADRYWCGNHYYQIFDTLFQYAHSLHCSESQSDPKR